MLTTVLIALGPTLFQAGSAAPANSENETKTGPAITANDIAGHIETLASDAFEGRGPGTEGEEKTVAYIKAHFQMVGLEPAGEGGSWIQSVPMIELTPDGSPLSTYKAGTAVETDLLSGRDVMLWSPVTGGKIALEDAGVVFAGYGIVAPEFGWNDYEGIDVKGKVVVVLVNDPGFRSQDPALFRGGAMTYYGRWTYKFEEAERQGAAGCLIVHEEDAAGYGWTVVTQSWGQPQLKVASNLGEPKTRIRGWITLGSATSMFKAAGADLPGLMSKAWKRGAKPVQSGATISASLSNRVSRLGSSNVLGKVTGSKRPDEYVLVCAHWDHLGKRAGAETEDNIYNGAVDNASGTAAMLELAEAVAGQPTPPERSILFLATTAEEKGLLGSAYYAANPVVPLAKTVCGLNIDVVNTFGPMKDIVIVGYGASELDDDLRAVAAAQGRITVPEATPERGYYFRSDHFSLAKVGVPMLYAGKGTVSVEHGEEWVAAQDADFLKKRYHRVRDEFDPTWNLEGAAQDVRLYHALLTMWSSDPRMRQWSADSEFRAAREASLAGKR